MRKKVKCLGLILTTIFLSVFSIQAENIYQTFNTLMGPSYYGDGTQDGWTYQNFQYESQATHIFEGKYAAALQTGYGTYGKIGFLTAPERTNGVGIVSLWAKIKQSIYNMDNVKLYIQISETDNAEESFTTVGTLDISAKNTTEYTRFFVAVNNANAKYVRLYVPETLPYSTLNNYVYLNIDELIITDAGKNANFDVSHNKISSEVNVETSSSILVNGTDVAGNVTFSLKTNSGFVLPTPSATATEVNAGHNLPVKFTPAKSYITYDTLIVKVADQPNFIFPIKGYGVAANIAEGFNNTSISTSYGNHIFEDWRINNGARLTEKMHEGAACLKLFGSVISPEKVKGVGDIAFWHRRDGANDLTYKVYTSDDAETWTEEGEITSTAEYAYFHKRVNSNTAKYVKVESTHAASSEYCILIDEFAISENNKKIARVSIDPIVESCTTTPYTFNVPVTFNDVADENVSFTIPNSQITAANESISPITAQGTYQLALTYTPEEGKSFASSSLTVTGGGIPFPFIVPITIHKEQESIFDNFDAEWGSGATGKHFTDAGWVVNNGFRNTYSLAFGGAADVALYCNSTTDASLISPPLSAGIGDIQFFVRTSNDTKITIATSQDGSTWTDKETFNMNNSTYSVHELNINDANAKYIRIYAKLISGYGNSVYIDNFTITKHGVNLSKVSIPETPFFACAEGATLPVNVNINGENISSELNISLAKGTNFSLGEITKIAANDINNKTYVLPITFTPQTDVFFTDEIIISGDDFNFNQTFPISGYATKDLLFQGFENAFINGNTMVDGWSMSSATRQANTANVYSGTAYLQLMTSSSNNAYIISPPKSNGVGTIQFYYRNSSYTNIDLIVKTYKNLNEEPTVIETISIPQASTYTKFEKTLNDPDIKYVEIALARPTTGSNYVYFDNIIVTANGKGIPQAIAPEKIDMSTNKGETATTTFEVKALNIDEKITLSLENGANFSIDTTELTPVDGQVEATITITYTPDANGNFSYDKITINGNSLLMPVTVPVSGGIMKHSLFQNFDATGWGNSEGSHVFEGWVMANAMRSAIPIYTADGKGASLNLKATNAKTGSIISPAKVPGVKDVSFCYYGSNNIDITYKVFTSVDNNTWTQVAIDTVNTATKSFANIEINDNDAKYVRITTESASTSYYSNFYIDDLRINGMPYIKQVEELETIETNEAVTIPVKLAGVLYEQAKLSMAYGENSKFTLSSSTIDSLDVADDAIYTLNLEFEAEESGTYTDAVFIADKDGNYYATVPVTVIYNKPHVALTEAVEAVTTSIVPLNIPVALEGFVLENVSLIITGDDAEYFSSDKTTFTSVEINDGVSFNITFNASESRLYSASVLIKGQEEEYLTIPLEVTYNKPYIASLSEVKPVETNFVPASIPVALGGLLIKNANISVTGLNAENFTPEKTTITPAEIAQGVNFNVSFTATEGGEYKAELLIADDENEYLRIPIEVNFVKTNVSLVNTIEPVVTDKAPVVIAVELEGFIVENAKISIAGDDADFFSCVKTEIAPEQLADTTYRFYVHFNSLKSKEYKANVIIADKDGAEYLNIPLSVKYNNPVNNGQEMIKFCDFETDEGMSGWKSYDLDGKVLSYIHNTAKAWYLYYEIGIEDPNSNYVMAATSMFASNAHDNITPANDWLFSYPLDVPANGSFGVAWDARSLHNEWLETYEMRVIEDATLTSLENSFSEQTTLAEVSEALLANSDLIFTIDGENNQWTTRNFGLDAYKGKTVRVIWRHISEEQVTLMVDNFRFYSEVLGSYIATAPETEYTQIPEFAMTNMNPEIEIVVNNGGTETLNNVKAVLSVKKVADDAVVYTKETTQATMAANQPLTIKTDNDFSIFADDYYYTVEVNGGAYSNTLVSTPKAGFEVTKNTYAYDNDEVIGGVYSDSQGFKVGQKYPIETQSFLESITFMLTENSVASNVNILIYEMKDNGQMELVSSVKNFAVKITAQNTEYTAMLAERIELSAGKTYFVAFEQEDGRHLYLAKTSNPVGRIAAYYTTNNAGWSWLANDHTLFIRLNAFKTAESIDKNIVSDIVVYSDNNNYLHVLNALPGDIVTVYDMQGKVVFNDTVQSDDESFATSLNNGIYIVRVGSQSFKLSF